MNELILIVDDEPGILEAMQGILDDEGYRTIVTTSGDEALRLFEVDRPDVVFLDIWLPDRDGLETLQAIRRIDPHAAVVMMSGHGTSATAVRSIKMGAHDYLEKPLSYDQTLHAIRSALEARSGVKSDAEVLEASRDRVEPVREFPRPAELTLLSETSRPQRTLATSMVIYGLGLHSGSRTGMVLQPLPPDTGIHFLTLPRGVVIPAHVDSVADTECATTLTGHGESIRTVEHLMSALHAAGISNLMVKVHGEIPVLDGSALEFCTRLEEVGIVDQDAPSREIVVDRTFEIATGNKRLVIEPWDRFRVSYQLSYPPPVGDQFFDFELESFASYKAEVAPARTFGFMRDMKMINELGLGSGGRLDNFILVGEDDVVNTELRFPDEFVRHKVLDIIGDLYLLGYPIRGRVTAALTGHRDNIQLQRQILKATAVG